MNDDCGKPTGTGALPPVEEGVRSGNGAVFLLQG
jgi:hypothetical protein